MPLLLIVQLSFRKGDVLKILDRNSEHWWWAELNGQVGYVPASYFTTDYLQQMYWQDEEYFGSYGKLVSAESETTTAKQKSGRN